MCKGIDGSCSNCTVALLGSALASLLKNVIARSAATKQSQKNIGNKGIAMRFSVLVMTNRALSTGSCIIIFYNIMIL